MPRQRGASSRREKSFFDDSRQVRLTESGRKIDCWREPSSTILRVRTSGNKACKNFGRVWVPHSPTADPHAVVPTTGLPPHSPMTLRQPMCFAQKETKRFRVIFHRRDKQGGFLAAASGQRLNRIRREQHANHTHTNQQGSLPLTHYFCPIFWNHCWPKPSTSTMRPHGCGLCD